MAGYYDRDRNPRTDAGVSGTRTMAGSMNYPAAHYGNSAEFMVSGWPCIVEVADQSGDTFDILLDQVTQWIVVSATGAAATVYFADVDSYTSAPGFVVPAGTISPRLDVKVSNIYVVTNGGTATVMAGLTNVKYDQLPSMVAWEGVGVVVDSSQGS